MMDFSELKAQVDAMSINEILDPVVTKVSPEILPIGYTGTSESCRKLQRDIGIIIDYLGKLSTAAQELKNVLTTSAKLRNSDHIVYLMKDPDGHGGAGALVGLLKVGRKHLFLHDEAMRSRELTALCVLDFFVLPAQQRAGRGRALFDFMLQDQGVDVNQLAIDGPSVRMENFLAKNYGTEKLLRQSNNFAVVPSFFSAQGAVNKGRQSERKKWSCPGQSVIWSGYQLSSPRARGRFAAPQPASNIASVIHGAARPAPCTGGNLSASCLVRRSASEESVGCETSRHASLPDGASVAPASRAARPEPHMWPRRRVLATTALDTNVPAPGPAPRTAGPAPGPEPGPAPGNVLRITGPAARTAGPAPRTDSATAEARSRYSEFTKRGNHNTMSFHTSLW